MTMSPQGAKTMKHASLKAMQLDPMNPPQHMNQLNNSLDMGLKYLNSDRKHNPLVAMN